MKKKQCNSTDLNLDPDLKEKSFLLVVSRVYSNGVNIQKLGLKVHNIAI